MNGAWHPRVLLPLFCLLTQAQLSASVCLAAILSCTKLPWSRLSRYVPRRGSLAPIAGTGKRVGPRFVCLQTKRCAWLWSARYPCSIFHHFWSRLSTPTCKLSLKAHDVALAVPPPRSNLPVPLTRPTSKVRVTLPLLSQLTRLFFQPMSRLSRVGLPAGSGRFCGLFATP
jgi:hypothetical protein